MGPSKMNATIWRRFGNVSIGLGVLATLVGVGLTVRVKPEVSAATQEAFSARYHYHGFALDPENDKRQWLVGSHGRVLHSEDCGKSWMVNWTGVEEDLHGITALDSNTLIAVGDNNEIVRSETSGQSWEIVSDVPKSDIENKLIQVRSGPDSKVWAVGVMGAVFVSHDKGRSFERAADPKDIAWNDIAFSQNGIWLVGEAGQSMYSLDGESWTEQKLPATESLMAASFNNNKGIIVGLGGTVMVSQNAGDSWERLTIDETAPLYAAVINEAGRATVGGANGMVYEINGSASKKSYSVADSLQQNEVVLKLDARNEKLFVMTEDGVYQRELQSIPISLSMKAQPELNKK